MPVLFSSMLDRFPRSKVLSLFSCCSGYHLRCDLVLEQRTTRSNETDTIIIDDMVLSEDECILNGWNTHFQRLSTPDPGIENTEDPSAMECTLIEEIAALIGDVFTVNPRCIGFCTLVRVGSIWSLSILSNILPRTGVTAMPL
jgi:hypothetical protein